MPVGPTRARLGNRVYSPHYKIPKFWQVACPTCEAKPGHTCRKVTFLTKGEVSNTCHKPRQALYWEQVDSSTLVG